MTRLCRWFTLLGVIAGAQTPDTGIPGNINAFNTPQFGQPGGTMGTGAFGSVTITRIDNRQIQLALKYTF